MSKPKDGRVCELLEEGLDFFGLGELPQAIACWEAVLAVDPGNAEARDYLATAAVGDGPWVAPPGTRRDPPDETTLLIARADWPRAFERLRAETADRPEALELQARLELVRSRLLGSLRQRIAADTTPVKVALVPSSGSLDLPAEAGFLLSIIDGSTSVEDLVSISGLDVFEVYRLLDSWIDAGVVEVRG